MYPPVGHSGTLDPTPEQLRGIDTLEQLFDFAGLTQPLRSSALEALGDSTTVREILFASHGDLEEVLATLRVPRPVADGGGVVGPSVQVSPVQKGVVRFLLRVTRLPRPACRHAEAAGLRLVTPRPGIPRARA